MKAKKDFKFKIEKVLGVLSESESGWKKVVCRTRINDQPTTLDIRKVFMDDKKEIAGKGISLQDKEVDSMVDTLLPLGYGTTEVLEKELTRRKKQFGITKEEDPN